jgi:hypothetical protein
MIMSFMPAVQGQVQPFERGSDTGVCPLDVDKKAPFLFECFVSQECGPTKFIEKLLSHALVMLLFLRSTGDTYAFYVYKYMSTCPGSRVLTWRLSLAGRYLQP